MSDKRVYVVVCWDEAEDEFFVDANETASAYPFGSVVGTDEWENDDVLMEKTVIALERILNNG